MQKAKLIPTTGNIRATRSRNHYMKTVATIWTYKWCMIITKDCSLHTQVRSRWSETNCSLKSRIIYAGNPQFTWSLSRIKMWVLKFCFKKRKYRNVAEGCRDWMVQANCWGNARRPCQAWILVRVYCYPYRAQISNESKATINTVKK